RGEATAPGKSGPRSLRTPTRHRAAKRNGCEERTSSSLGLDAVARGRARADRCARRQVVEGAAAGRGDRADPGATGSDREDLRPIAHEADRPAGGSGEETAHASGV